MSQAFLASSELAKAGYLQQTAIDRLRQAHLQGQSDHGQRLWLLVNAEAWFRMHVQNVSQVDMSAQIAEVARNRSVPTA